MFMFFGGPFVEMEEELRIQRRRLRDSNNVFDLPKKNFIKEFRVNKEVFKNILDEIAPRMMKRHRSTAIPEMTKLACFMRLLAGNYQKNIGNNRATCVSQAMTSQIVSECLDIFEDSFCSKWINLGMTKEEENKRKEEFYRETSVPGVVGCVDCTHIAIQCPRTKSKYLYQNEKGLYSINTLMICDANLVVRFVDARHPGENADSYIWEMSAANQYFKSMYDCGKRNYWLIGDSDFPLQPYLMTPFQKAAKSCEVVYNEKLLKAHQIIEKCFYAIKSRFCCISGAQELHYQPEKTTKLINTCCAIHNACVFYKDDLLINELKYLDFVAPNLNDNSKSDNESNGSLEAIECRQILSKCIRRSP